MESLQLKTVEACGSGSLQAERDEVDEGPKVKHTRDGKGGG